MSKKAFIFLAEGFEETEAITIIDLLRRAEIDVTTVSIQETDWVMGAHHIPLKTDVRFAEVPSFEGDLLLLPGGGKGVENLKKYEPLANLLVEHHKQNKYLGAICAAPSILGQLGLLEGKKAVCYPGFEGQLLGAHVGMDAVVQDGMIITSRGLGTAIAFSLALIGVLQGDVVADRIAADILYV